MPEPKVPKMVREIIRQLEAENEQLRIENQLAMEALQVLLEEIDREDKEHETTRKASTQD